MVADLVTAQEQIEEGRTETGSRPRSTPPREPESAAVLSAAFTMYRATEQLSALDAESRAVARLAAEALMRGDVSRAALALVARVEGRRGILDLLRGSAQAQPG
jgi:hypothetical protein